MLLFGYKSMLLFGNNQVFFDFFFLHVMFSLLQYLIILVKVESLKKIITHIFFKYLHLRTDQPFTPNKGWMIYHKLYASG